MSSANPQFQIGMPIAGNTETVQVGKVDPQQQQINKFVAWLNQPAVNQANMPDYNTMAQQTMLQGQNRVNNALLNPANVRPWFKQTGE
jgi:hypothetical protein